MKKAWILFLFAWTLLVWISFAKENIVACTMEYAPVCAEVQVQCIKAPCPAIKTTFGNKCMMNANQLARFLYEWECKETKSPLENTKWILQSFDDKIATWSTLSFADGRMSAKICNNMSADYSIDWNKFVVEMMMSTKMACMWEVSEYEKYFDLSWASYELSTDGWNHMVITTIDGHKYQRQNTYQNPWKAGMVNPASVFCAENSGNLEILSWTGWEYGVCKFVDGSKCEEWKYFRWECKPEYKKIHNVFNKYFEKYLSKFQTFQDRKNFLEEFKSQLQLISKWAKLWLKKTYNKIIQAIELYR